MQVTETEMEVIRIKIVPLKKENIVTNFLKTLLKKID